MTSVAIQGAAGSFHHLAAQKWFGENVRIVSCKSFADVFGALETRRAGCAIVAIENSLYGSVSEVYDLLLTHNYPIIGELPEHIHQQLIGYEGTRPDAITRVYSHPVALNQCRKFLDAWLPGAERIEYHDTAESVAFIKSLNDPTAAAIASHTAARLHEMKILHTNIEDETTNFTRFLILRPGAEAVDSANKASLVLRTDHSPGALHRALGVFASLGINMTKLQSRPIRGRVFKYQFFVDIEADAEQLAIAVERLTAQECEVTVLEHYKAAEEIVR